MVLDELVYDPASGTGSMAVDMVEGAFSFVSGEIAKTGPDSMKINTSCDSWNKRYDGCG